jgi:ubiquitin-protein ligase
MGSTDELRILIVGPQGTPYEHGLFEFDLWCPPEYPNAPPIMQFKGTAGGVLSVNPNLHPDGKGTLSR